MYVFGGPGVETKLELPEPVGVKFLQFATSSFQLLVLGELSSVLLFFLLSDERQIA